jgi:hypothetical protein
MRPRGTLRRCRLGMNLLLKAGPVCHGFALMSDGEAAAAALEWEEDNACCGC